MSPQKDAGPALFDLPETAPVVAGLREWFDPWAAVARQKLNVPAEWEWYEVRTLNDAHDVLVTGGVPNVATSRRKKWAGIKGQQLVVTAAEKDAACLAFERESGKCYECYGSGETVASCGVSGTTYRQCRRCKGAKTPPALSSEKAAVEGTP